MILHLLKTDWQRLRLPILGVWALLLLTTLPWCFYEPSSFSAPLIESQSGSYSDIDDRAPAPMLNAELVRNLLAAAVLLLSSAIGMHGIGWQLVSPIRPWKKVSAKLAAILAFIVCPQLILGLLVLFLHDFTLPTILAATAGTAFSLTLLHASAALFAYRCGSMWVWLAASAALLGMVSLIAPMLPGNLGDSLTTLVDPWAANRGPAAWAFVTTAVIALCLLPGRRRPGTIAGVAASIVSLVLAALAFHHSPSTAQLPSKPGLPPEILAGIEAEIVPGSVEFNDLFHAPPGEFRVEAKVRSAGRIPANTFVTWSAPIPAWSNEGRYRNAAFPRPHGDTDRAALAAVLPAPLMPNPQGTSYADNSISRTFSDSRLEAPRFDMKVRGLVFRYRTLAELPFSLATATTSADRSETLLTRRHPTPGERPLLEVVHQSPALGIATDHERLTWQPSPLDTYRFVLHLPRAGLCVPLDNFDLTRSLSPIPAGGAWTRQLLKPRHWPQPFDLTDARLIILKPGVLAWIARDIPLSREFDNLPAQQTDWMLSRNYGLSLAAYLRNHRPFRPDPATCSAAEFARYLRTVSAIPYSSFVERDLAEYAPRFTRLLALHSQRKSSADAITLGTPELERDTVLNVLRENPALAPRLAETLIERDWQSGDPGILLEVFREHRPAHTNWHAQGLPLARHIVVLEDPATYPALLAALEETRSFAIYEMIRHLPGIDSALEKSIERISRELSPAAELAGTRPGLYFEIFDAFKVPISHGNELGLCKLLELWRMIPPEANSFDTIRRFTLVFEAEPAIPETIDAWRDFIAGKSLADFTYDPLTRKWHAPSSQL